MALWFNLMANRTVVGFVWAERQGPVPDDRVCTYDIGLRRVDGTERRASGLRHNFDDGAFVLMAKALARLTENDR